MNIRHIAYLSELARCGSFSVAAQRLGIAQPTLTQALKKAELDLGVPLFERDGRELRVTQYGRVFLDAGAYITALYADAENKMEALRLGLTGSVRVAVAPSRAPYALPAVLARFKRLYPGVCVEVTERLTAGIDKDVANGLADLGILVAEVGANPRLNYLPLGEERILLAAPEELCPPGLANGEGEGPFEAPLSAFENVPFVLLGEDQPIEAQFSAYCRAHGLDPRPAARCRNIETALSLANAGIGAATVTSSGVAHYRTAFPRLKYFDPFGGALTRRLWLICRKNMVKGDPCEALITEILQEQT